MVRPGVVADAVAAVRETPPKAIFCSMLGRTHSASTTVPKLDHASTTLQWLPSGQREGLSNTHHAGRLGRRRGCTPNLGARPLHLSARALGLDPIPWTTAPLGGGVTMPKNSRPPYPPPLRARLVELARADRQGAGGVGPLPRRPDSALGGFEHHVHLGHLGEFPVPFRRPRCESRRPWSGGRCATHLRPSSSLTRSGLDREAPQSAARTRGGLGQVRSALQIGTRRRATRRPPAR